MASKNNGGRTVADLAPNPRNPRVITDRQRELLRQSLIEFGDLSGIVFNVRTRRLVGGHQRIEGFKALDPKIEIAQRLGKPDRCGTVAYGHVLVGGSRYSYREVDWPEAREIAANLAANKHGGDFDQKLVAELLRELKDDGLDLELTGFDGNELDRIFVEDTEEGPEPKIDQAKELLKKWKVKRGQVWEIGEHRLMCGDSTDGGGVQTLLRGSRPHLMVTDPPYGVNYDPNWRNLAARHSAGMGNRCIGAGALGRVVNDNQADWSAAWDLYAGDVAYVWHAGRYSSLVHDSLERSGFEVRSQIIWVKSHFAIGRGDYHWQHEPCWYAVRRTKNGHWNGARDQTTTWAIDKQTSSETGHSTQKPVECMARPIRNNSREADLVYDPFCGSGTTLVACEQLRRKCLALEIAPEYVAVTLERLSDMGLKPRPS